jgi:hypothetical protein
MPLATYPLPVSPLHILNGVGDGKNTLISNDPHARKSFKQVQLTLFQASI